MFARQFKFSCASQLTAFGQESKVYLKQERSTEEAQKQNCVMSSILSWLKQLPVLEQMGNLSFWCYFVGSAHVGNGLQQLEIQLIFDDPSPTLPSWRDEPYRPLPCVLQIHARHFVSCLWKNSDPNSVTISVWMQIMKHPPDGWWLKTSHLSTAMKCSFFWPLCREVNCVISPPVFRGGLLTGEISLVCGFVYADLSKVSLLGWELFTQT